MVNGNPVPKKKLGQHFLINPHYSRKIVEAIPADTESCIVEIGPGKGALSRLLVQRFKTVHLIEIDEDIIPVLRQILGEYSYILHREDVLLFDFDSICSPFHVVGNLPYNNGAFIIHKTLPLVPELLSVTYMVQREVAERIAAKPGTKQYGYLSVYCQYFGVPRILFHCAPGCFYPPPQVASSVFQIVPDPGHFLRLPMDEWDFFFSFVRKCFSMRRKTLGTILSWKKKTKELWLEELEMLRIPAKARPEALPVDDWIRLYKRHRELAA